MSRVDEIKTGQSITRWQIPTRRSESDVSADGVSR